MLPRIKAVDAAALVIQHPSGKLERMYWPVTAREVMKTNPGHYVSLIIPLPSSGGGGGGGENTGESKTVRFTRVKLLRPTDTLVLGHAYRLVTTQEVVKVLRAKKHAKMKLKNQTESVDLEMISDKSSSTDTSKSEAGKSAPDKNDKKPEEKREERHRQRPGSTNLGGGRPKSWRPSLQSISESGS
ncbi:hypothetical protein BUALT_Bualt17G0051200 [Buddleja alternifolia]|uniref:Uncharacterized protein n=1 Tax=Buddleja alternifolia TaxID=168488 RepID=A0AAV6W6C5_9LAMI|nr:hypothetical protein BUALT_Bualt17G0051200 [Buddleja alternifolia]